MPLTSTCIHVLLIAITISGLPETGSTKKLMTKCRHGWNQFGGSEYKIGRDHTTYLRSELTCNQFGASLVNIESKAESDFLKQHLAPCHDNFWIGLNWRADSFHWSQSSQSPKFTDWDRNMPYDGILNYCVIATQRNGYKWSNIRCRSSHNYICEKKSSV